MLPANANPFEYQRNLESINNITEKKTPQKSKFISKQFQFMKLAHREHNLKNCSCSVGVESGY